MAIKVERVVFLSLLLDLFAFTIPLPLFPRIIEWYTVVSFGIFLEADKRLNNPQRESAHPDGFLARTLRLVSGTRSTLLRTPAKNPQKWDIVLLGEFKVKPVDDQFLNDSPGGFMGSIFSSVHWSSLYTYCESDVTTAHCSSSSHLTSAPCLTSMAERMSSSSQCWATYCLRWSGFNRQRLPLTRCQG